MKNDSAILLAAFCRVNYARKAFNAIKAAKPSKFYFYTNAPSPDNPDECRNNEKIRAMAEEVDWPCEFKTWFRDKPVGALDSIRSAINWVFEHEDKAIIMEDDCVGSPAWFNFANEMLDKYQDDKRIWMIGGSNYAEDYNPHCNSYHFSRNFFISGWASWKDRWMQIDWNHLCFGPMLTSGLIDSYYPDARQRRLHKSKISKYGENVESSCCWDFAFWYTGVAQYAFSIIPSKHLVQNIGISGVHQGPLAKLLGKRLIIPYNQVTFKDTFLDTSNPPKYICPDNKYDAEVFKKWVNKNNIWYVRIIRSTYHLIKNKLFKIQSY